MKLGVAFLIWVHLNSLYGVSDYHSPNIRSRNRQEVNPKTDSISIRETACPGVH